MNPWRCQRRASAHRGADGCACGRSRSRPAWVVENGVTNGTTASTFSPSNGCTRAQIVTFLFRTYQGK